MTMENKTGSVAPAQKIRWRRKNPYMSTVSTNKLLSGEGSAKEIRHYEFDLGDSGITYTPGDGLAVIPENDPALVSEMLTRLEIAPDIEIAKYKKSIHAVLLTELEICKPSTAFLKAVAENNSDGELAEFIAKEDKSDLEKWLWGKDTLDILNIHPDLSFDAEGFVKLLRPLMHRTYSISSSQSKHPTQIHATIATVRYEANNRQHGGVCSAYLSDRVAEGSEVGIFMVPTKTFLLPEDDNANILMIGPGTGVAPFLSFLQERQHRRASGQNWLFFGDQHQACDFIYQEELEEAVSSGILNRLDLAFSRDQEEKIYVQHRLKEHGAEINSWIENGAYIYVCGDAEKMAPDVNNALAEIIAEHGGKTVEEALEYLEQLQISKCYLKDVY